MNYTDCTVYCYAWFADTQYGMNLDYSLNLDIDGDIMAQIRQEMAWREKHDIHLKGKTILGHVFIKAVYMDKNGFYIEYK